MKTTRTFSPYEKTHLARFRVSQEEALAYPTTPVEYLTGKVEFGGFIFEVNNDVLIPRPETEECVARAIEICKEKYVTTKKSLLLADIGTGCGVIAICLSANLQRLNIPHLIIATDVSHKALVVAQNNLEHLVRKPLDANLIRFEQRNLLTDWPASKPLDLIIANLPYVPHDFIGQIEASVLDHEPHVAIFGGDDGFDLITILIEQSTSVLKPKGTILLEINYTHPPLLHEVAGSHFQVKTWQSPISKCTFGELIARD